MHSSQILITCTRFCIRENYIRVRYRMTYYPTVFVLFSPLHQMMQVSSWQNRWIIYTQSNIFTSQVPTYEFPSARLYEHQNRTTTSCFTRWSDPLRLMTSSKLQKWIYGSSSKLHTLRIQFQTRRTTSSTKTKTTSGTRRTAGDTNHTRSFELKRNLTYRSQLSLPGWIGPSLRREGTPLNPRSGGVGSVLSSSEVTSTDRQLARGVPNDATCRYRRSNWRAVSALPGPDQLTDHVVPATGSKRELSTIR